MISNFSLQQNNFIEMKQSRITHNHEFIITSGLKEELKKASVSSDISEQICQLMANKEHKIYYLYTNNRNEYFAKIWDELLYQFPDLKPALVDKLNQKQEKVTDDLKKQKILIERRNPIHNSFDTENKVNKFGILQSQSDNLRNKIKQISSNIEEDNNGNSKNDTQSDIYSQSKIKETQQAIRLYREARLQRRKKIEEQKKREESEEKKKQEQQKCLQQKLANQKKQQLKKLHKQLQQKREMQKLLRQQRNTQYMRIKKQSDQKPPLFSKLYENYSKRYQQEEHSRFQKMQSEKKIYKNPINNQILQKHSKQYEYLRQKKQKQRKQKQSLAQNEQKSRIKFHSSYQIQKYQDPKQIQRQIARQKIQKIRQYKSLVKERFMPKIDEEKRKQLMNIIQELELNNKHVKKVRLENGSVMYEQLKPIDHRMIGMSYLEQVKQMAAKSRNRKKSDKEVKQATDSQQSIIKKKPSNYLEELRKMRPKQEKLQFIQKQNMSYDDKIDRVIRQSERLALIAKQNQMMLKFGKFKTSQQILDCKDQIDQNYLDIVNMKLKLILNQPNSNQVQGQS